MEPVSNLKSSTPPRGPYSRKSAEAKPSEPASAPVDRVELSDEGVAASNGQASRPAPRTYGPRCTLVDDSAARPAGLSADTNRSRHLSDIMSEIAAVQQSTSELLARQRQLRI